MIGIDEKLVEIRQKADRRIASLQLEADRIIEEMENEIDNTLAAYGLVLCPKCSATGAVERLDSGYMRRFGLREWNGCKNCGGDGNETRGKGYVTKE